MRQLTMGALLACVALAGCGDKGNGGNASAGGSAMDAVADTNEPVVRQPGSWSTKIEIPRLEGPGVKPGMREQMQQMFTMLGSMSVCLTPEALAQEDIAKDMEKNSGNQDCTFDKKDVVGSKIALSGTCERDGKKVKMTITGTNTPTAQDFTMVIEGMGDDVSLMEMHMTSTRNGECKPGDITPPSEDQKGGLGSLGAPKQ